MSMLRVVALLCALQTCLSTDAVSLVRGPSIAHLVYGPGGSQRIYSPAKAYFFTNRVRDFDDRVVFDSSTSEQSGTDKIPPPVEATTAAPPPAVPLSSATAEEDVSANAIPGGGRAPSRCVWAIVSCCTPQSSRVRHACFDTLGCRGPFWDNSPCDGRFAQSAAKAALDFYTTG